MEALPYILIINGALIALFIVYVLTTRVWQTLLWRMFPKKVIVPMFGAKVKIRTSGAIYDSRFRGITQQGWAIESLAEAIPAIRMGDPVLVEIACERGVVRFRSELVELLSHANATVMRPPLETVFGNRRNKKRVVMENRPMVQIEGASGAVFDLSEGGTRISTNKPFRRGERVKIEIPGWKEPLTGHVLEVLPNATRGFVNDVRIVFENPVKLAALTKKIASA
jgi:hypothetical protein